MVCCLKKICLFAIALIFILPCPGFAGYEYIDITNPFLRKIPVAIPAFKTISGDYNAKRACAKTSDLLCKSLQFTGYFKILEQKSFPLKSVKSDVVSSDIDFKKWAGIGAEFLISGKFLLQNNRLAIELRLYDTIKKQLLVGKKYQGSIKYQRKIIHRFCSEIISNVTGGKGIFNSEIAFVSTHRGDSRIYICEFDGNNPTIFTSARNIILSPAWSWDGNWIAYTAYAKGMPGLYIKHRSKNQGTIFKKQGVKLAPAWVPGKLELAATFSFSGDQEIYLLTGTGKIIKRLTHNRGIDLSPAWSPDGKQMAFVSKRSGTPQIYIKHMASGRVYRLTFEGNYNQQPAWSPTGDKIAYTRMENGRCNIYLIDTNGNSSVRLTHNAGDNESPSWSPDGSLILFSSTREGPSRIYVMTRYGTDQRRLLTLPGEQKTPQWSK